MNLSIRAYARHRNVSEGAVRKAIRKGRIPQEPDGTIDPAKADPAWDRNTNPAQQRQPNQPKESKQQEAGPPSKASPNYQTSRAVKETYAAKLAKLEYEVRTGKLINADDVRMEAFNLARRVRDRILTIPHRLAAVLSAETDANAIERILMNEFRTALEELSQEEER